MEATCAVLHSQSTDLCSSVRATPPGLSLLPPSPETTESRFMDYVREFHILRTRDGCSCSYFVHRRICLPSQPQRPYFQRKPKAKSHSEVVELELQHVWRRHNSGHSNRVKFLLRLKKFCFSFQKLPALPLNCPPLLYLHTHSPSRRTD